MTEQSQVRPGEVTLALPDSFDAGVYFIGRIRTPFKSRAECPKNTAQSEAVGHVELDARYAAGLQDLGLYSHVHLLYWMDRARRDLIQQVPAHLAVRAARSRCARRCGPIRSRWPPSSLRSPGRTLTVRNVDCIDGTPLLDIKPYFASIDSIPDARRPDRA